MTEKEDSEQILESVKDLKIGLIEPYEMYQPRKIEFSETGQKRRFQFPLPTTDEEDELEAKKEALDQIKQVLQSIQDQYDEAIYECKKCGDLFSKPPEKCEECGGTSFKLENFEPINTAVGPAMFSLVQNQGELYFEISDMRSQKNKFVFQQALPHLDEVMPIIDRMKEYLEDKHHTGEFDLDAIESGVSESERTELQTVKAKIMELKGDNDEVEVSKLLDELQETEDIDPDRTSDILDKLKRDGELFEPRQGYVQQI